ncbi:capsular polysaccharide synthesis protein [Lactococcus cremoris]|uniref:capsular polysaccharide synthesis protein n=1 Tax=Lactococcus lactis subsp. cremoris TaxID=1359 RepID=UPI0021D1E9BD|nr:capsular polysaccharide synthesis protein [Lactococcus cremoris]UXV63486.1 capsular polysaccharide synthesis protein [Lactococcus cremoris]
MRKITYVKIANKLDTIFRTNVTKKLAIEANARYQKKVVDKLSPLFQDLLSSYKNKSSIQLQGKVDDIVWMMWWQGEEVMPPLVKACYQQAKKIYGDNVIIISKNNYMKYVDISPKIIEKFSKNQISITNFSDVLRINLLYKNGGLWVDGTVFMTNKIGENLIGTLNFFSVKKNPTRIYNKYISENKWTSYFIASSAKNLVFKVLVEMYNIYFDTYDEVFEYFLIDYLIYFVYKYNISGFKQTIDSLPITNSDIFLLESFMNKPIQIKESLEIDKDTFLNKLSWKKEHQIFYSGQKTYYAALLNGDLLNLLKEPVRQVNDF